MSDPRVRPGGRAEVGLVNWTISRIAGRVAGTNPPNLFLTLGRHPRLFRGWLRFAGRLMPGGDLPRRETEIVILRVAHLRESEYELVQHKRLGRKAGLTETDIGRIARGPSDDDWSRRERVLLEVADELVRSQDIGDATWTRLREHLDERRCIELLMLVGHYEMLATFIKTLRVQPDA
jgi:AhpD family alkylhydroperoxidase